jgi:predicted nuclease of predicted toxin-antitoxin system
MTVLIDMNLSPLWVTVLCREGFDAVHWSQIGDPRAKDLEIMVWARSKGRVVFTHDLDFGALLVTNHSVGPSVLQIRAQDVTPEASGGLVIRALNQFREHLERGALVIVDESRMRARLLPIGT